MMATVLVGPDWFQATSGPDMAARLRDLGIYGVDIDLLHSVEDLGDAYSVTTYVPCDRDRTKVQRIGGTPVTITTRHEKVRPS